MSDLFDPEEEPDGDALAPHHMYLGLIIQLAGGAGALFAFASVWPYYPTIGAAGTLAALGLMGLGWVVAVDDAIEHATVLPTPLDQLWNRAVYPIVQRIEDRGNESGGE
ncbi:hypothetical protein GJ633_04080 [Halorubrum sp. CBA1125]|uniref:hypothetical protein n=1 Tax=Halorubrum sp. CBA1125 TaxID=2668072 RepID=UPI0012E964D5|nr:hypothetical protein [Halorubrum sp. CBA1125]MUW13930.1 hypothetical protein [Halorubrum sp. CBA1125]